MTDHISLQFVIFCCKVCCTVVTSIASRHAQSIELWNHSKSKKQVFGPGSAHIPDDMFKGKVFPVLN